MASPAKARLFSAKQIIFACILVTVVSVTAFVAGVVVGRDSPYRTLGPARDPGAAMPGAPQVPPRLVIVGEPEGEPAAGPLDEVTYPDRLGNDGPHDEKLRRLPLYTAAATPLAPAATTAPPPAEAPPAAGPAPAGHAAGSAAADAARPAAAPGAAAPVSPPAESEPYTVQVAALRAAGAAEAFAGRLIAKGFPAYVVAPAAEGPVAMYRVRVGRYADQGEAERMRRRLQQEEQLTPWITR